MISHFQWKELRNNILRREWEFSFYFKGSYYKGIYEKSGAIKWNTKEPESSDKKQIEGHIHDLMLYHIYEDHYPHSKG